MPKHLRFIAVSFSPSGDQPKNESNPPQVGRSILALIFSEVPPTEIHGVEETPWVDNTAVSDIRMTTADDQANTFH